MNYIAYHFKVNPPQPGTEILIAMLSEYDFNSFDTDEHGFTAYISEEGNSNVDFTELTFDDFAYTYSTEKIARANWNSEWEKNFEPVIIEDLLCIRAPFHEKNIKVQYEIVVMPKMSFGTGHHQTTRLVCKQMFTLNLQGKRVLDMGCGTGILAILAKKLGAKEILAIDIDEWSVENSIENCHANSAGQIEVKKGDIEDLSEQNPFDVIFANINKNVLKKHLPFYAKKLKPNGNVVLSGFFATDIEELTQVAADCKLVLSSVNSEMEWAVMVLKYNL